MIAKKKRGSQNRYSLDCTKRRKGARKKRKSQHGIRLDVTQPMEIGLDRRWPPHSTLIVWRRQMMILTSGPPSASCTCASGKSGYEERPL